MGHVRVLSQNGLLKIDFSTNLSLLYGAGDSFEHWPRVARQVHREAQSVVDAQLLSSRPDILAILRPKPEFLPDAATRSPLRGRLVRELAAVVI